MSAHRTHVRERLDREDREDLIAQLDEQLGIQPSEYSAGTRPLVYTSRERGPRIVTSSTTKAEPPKQEHPQPVQNLDTFVKSQDPDSINSDGITKEPLPTKEKSPSVGGVLGSIKENDSGQYEAAPHVDPTPQGFPEAYHRSQKPMSRFKAAKLAGKLTKEDTPTPSAAHADGTTPPQSSSSRSGVFKAQRELAHQLNNPSTLSSILSKKLDDKSDLKKAETTKDSLSESPTENSDVEQQKAEVESGKRTRFNSTPEIFTYEAEERPPRQPIAYLPPPPSMMPDFDSSNISLENPLASSTMVEGDSEYIRRRYFPNEPSPSSLNITSDPLAWTRPDSANHVPEPDSSERPIPHFDINGKFTELKIPKHAKFSDNHDHNHDHAHHHAGENLFTLPSLLTLSNSSVMGQRSSAFLIMEKILRSNLLSISKNNSKNAESNEQLEYLTTSNLEQVLYQACQAVDDRSVSVAATALSVLATILCPWSEIANENSLESDKENVIRRFCFQKCVTMRPNLLSRLKLHLQNGTLPRPSLLTACNITYSLVEIGTSQSPSESQLDPIQAILDEPSFLESIVTRFIAVQWPPLLNSNTNNKNNDHTNRRQIGPANAEWDEGLPATIAVKIMAEMVRLSREAAMEILNRELLDPLIRFIAVPPWELEEVEKQEDEQEQESPKDTCSKNSLSHIQYGMLIHTFDVLSKLSKYKLATEICCGWAPLFGDFHNHLCKLARVDANEDIKTVVKYWNTLLVELANSSVQSPLPFPTIDL